MKGILQFLKYEQRIYEPKGQIILLQNVGLFLGYKLL